MADSYYGEITPLEIYEYLEHHGVKGMKWGVVKQRISSAASSFGSGVKKVGSGVASGASATGRALKKGAINTGHGISTGVHKVQDAHDRHVGRVNERHAKKERRKLERMENRNLKAMSSEELRSKIARIQLEQQYAALTAPQKSKGRLMVQRIAEKSIEQLGQNVANAAINNSFERVTGRNPKTLKK